MQIDLEAALRLADEAERVASEATPGPFYSIPMNNGVAIRDASHRCVCVMRRWEVDDERKNESNVPLMVSARTIVPALAELVRGLMEMVREYPAWHPKPPIPGSYIWASTMHESAGLVRVDDVENVPREATAWFGPLPAVPKSEESTNA